MRYIVTKSFRPKGSNNPEAKPGSELDLDTSQARVFKALGWIKDKPADAKPAAPVRAVETVQTVTAKRPYVRRIPSVYQTRVMVPENPAKTDAEDE